MCALRVYILQSIYSFLLYSTVCAWSPKIIYIVSAIIFLPLRGGNSTMDKLIDCWRTHKTEV